ncbi:NUDIX hydrolase [Kocuria sp.]|uniref:NUDIX hydrolase n=1 Tax=Kocuria sp. TaxID=1871328 RepID=UPI0026E0F04E|nr:CoA pyrophosphatase [Kocuria sp.]MDO5618569.1 CoA pyrophosphatase [Kocuria sp.]
MVSEHMSAQDPARGQVTDRASGSVGEQSRVRGEHGARQELIRAIRELDGGGPLRIQDIPAGENMRESAVLILVGALDETPPDLDLLLVQRAPTLRAHPGQVAFPGGRLDPEDGDPHDPADRVELPGGVGQAAYVRAALREAQEETGLDPAGVEILGMLPRTPLAVSSHQVTPVVGWWSKPVPVEVVDHAESSLVFRTPIADLVNASHRHYAEVQIPGPDYPRLRHRSPAFRIPRTITDPAGGSGDVVVWGFTGILLDHLLSAAGWNLPWDTTDIRPAPL